MEAQKETFNFELVSPERKLLSGPARMVLIPGEEGDVGVLPRHSSLISSIRPGVIEVFGAEGEAPRRIFVAGGFADITPESCTVLAEEAVNVADLSLADLERAAANLQEDLDMAETDVEKAKIARKLDVTRKKRQAVSGLPVH